MKMKVAALALGWCFLLAGFSRCTAEESNPSNNQPKYSPNVKQIIIVFKTHFDIGYTDTAMTRKPDRFCESLPQTHAYSGKAVAAQPAGDSRGWRVHG